jgi:3',5'-cyclic AMP phosphodiesterase CpdA
MKAVFIADPHIKADHQDNVVVEQHLSKLDPTDWIIVVGDVTDNGIAEEYAEALRLLSPWKGHCVLVPGNHDCDGLHGLRWSAQAAARWAKFTQDMKAVGELHLGEWFICALDSVNAEPNILELAQGELGEAELNRAKDAIQAARKAGHKVCLTMHHNPVDNLRMAVGRPLTDAEDRFLNWAEKLKDSTDFFKIAYGEADLIICGHTHLRMSWTSSQGVPTLLVALGDFRGQGDTFIL